MSLISVRENVQIHTEIFNEQLPQPVFFIHGNLASNRWWIPAREVWTQQMREQGLEKFQSPMILGEFPGCGLSTPPANPEDVNMNLFADYFISVIRQLKGGPVHLVGHSTGGLIAALMLARAPELFRKAVLLDPVGAHGVSFDNSVVDAFEQMKTNRDLVSTVMSSTIHGNDPDSTFFQKVLVEDAQKAVRQVGPWVLQALKGLDVTSQLKNVEAPVLVLHGEHDVVLPLEDSRALAQLMKNAEFKIIPNAGHCTNVEQPKTFVSLVSGFLFS